MSEINPIGPANSILAQHHIRSAMEMGGGNLEQAVSQATDIEQAEILANQLESSLVSMMLSQMRKSVQETDLFGAKKSNATFMQMLDQEYVQLASREWNFGFHDSLVQEIMGSSPAGAASDDAGAEKEPDLKPENTSGL